MLPLEIMRQRKDGLRRGLRLHGNKKKKNEGCDLHHPTHKTPSDESVEIQRRDPSFSELWVEGQFDRKVVVKNARALCSVVGASTREDTCLRLSVRGNDTPRRNHVNLVPAH